MTVRVYVEGGGDHRGGELATQARQAFSTLIHEATGQKVAVVACGGRSQTLDAWKTRCSLHPGDVNLLLVDSEAPVRDGEDPVTHLRRLEAWEFPADVPRSRVHLMTQVMETWLIADPDALARVFGKHFDKSKLTSWPQLEAVAKDALFEALKKATTRKPYAKGAHSFKVLAELDPARLQAACPSARRFFGTIMAEKSR